MPKKHYETDNAFGKKLLQVMEAKGIANDLPKLAEAFGVTVPSTYDWLRHGRFAKERYAQLVAWSERDLHWWFDLPPGMSTVNTFTANEPRATYSRPAWPFPAISEQALCRMSPADLQRIEGAVMLVLGQLDALETVRAA